MAFAFGHLRLAPDSFWNMTPREFDAALHGINLNRMNSAPPARGVFDNLMQAYPDIQ